MTDKFENALDRVDFTDGKIDLDGEGGGGQLVRWAKLTLAHVNGTAFDSSGGTMKIPEVINGKGEVHEAHYRKPGNVTTFWFTLDSYNKDGEPYRLIEDYTQQPRYRVEDNSNPPPERKDKAISVDGMEGFKSKFPYISLSEKQVGQFAEKGYTYISDLSNLQKPAIAAQLGSKANELQKGGLWCRIGYTTFRANEDKNGKIDEYTGRVKVYYDQYMTDFTIFESEEAWKAAWDAERNSAENSGGGGVVYPWSKEHVDSMLTYIAGDITMQTDLDQAVEDWKFGDNPNEANVKIVLKEAIDRKDVLPPQKDELKKFVDNWEVKPF